MKPTSRYNTLSVTLPELVALADTTYAKHPYRIAVAGYTSPPNNYDRCVVPFLDAVVRNLGGADVVLVTSPTTGSMSVDALVTLVAHRLGCAVLYLTCHEYAHCIRPDRLPSAVNAATFADAPKYILPSKDAYSAATALASGAFVAIGGGVATLKDFCHAVEKGNRCVLVDVLSIRRAAWDVHRNTVGNASLYLADQIDALAANKHLPHPLHGAFTLTFVNANRSKLLSLVLVVDFQPSNQSQFDSAVQRTYEWLRK